MTLAKCEKGHIYDSDTYSSCPYCSEDDSNTINFSEGYVNDEKINPEERESRTRDFPHMDEISKTRAPESYRKKQEEMSKTVGVFTRKTKMDPVVGWLVCIEGQEKGKDYRLGAKTNTIGRGETMDVCIKGDQTISSDKHAKLDYDIKNNNFYLIPAENKNTIYLNDVPVYAAAKLNAYDVIQLGESKVLFIPLCGDKFKWAD